MDEATYIDISAFLRKGIQGLNNRKEGGPRTLSSEETSKTESSHNATYNSIKRILAKGIRRREPPASAITKQKHKIP